MCLGQMWTLKSDLPRPVDQFSGNWIDNEGNSVVVYASTDAGKTNFRAVLTGCGGQKSLPLFQIESGWQCGSAVLDKSSNSELCWKFLNGKVSTWRRYQEAEQASPAFTVPVSVSLKAEEHVDLLECLSPAARYFDTDSMEESEFFGAVNMFAMSEFQYVQDEHRSGLINSSLASPDCALDAVQGKVWQWSRHRERCWDIQRMLEEGNNSLCLMIATELRGHMWDAVENPSANHVLQKLITNLFPEQCQFIIDELMSQPGCSVHLAQHRFGCRIFERLLEHCPPSQIATMVEEVLEVSRALCKDPFGNYVMQHLLEYGTPQQRQRICSTVGAHLAEFCTDPKAPSVVAKVLELGTREQQRCVVQALLQNMESLAKLASARFGHVIVVALLRSQLEDEERNQVRHLLANPPRQARQSRHAKKVMQCFDDTSAGNAQAVAHLGGA